MGSYLIGRSSDGCVIDGNPHGQYSQRIFNMLVDRERNAFNKKIKSTTSKSTSNNNNSNMTPNETTTSNTNINSTSDGNANHGNAPTTPTTNPNKGYSSLASLHSSNAFAVGQLINHSKENANVLCCDYTFYSSDFPTQLVGYIPNLLFTNNNNRNSSSIPRTDMIAKSIVFIATRDIRRGEELFFDYRYNQARKAEDLPPWYTQ